jgi:circadian clock protein KaiB
VENKSSVASDSLRGEAVRRSTRKSRASLAPRYSLKLYVTGQTPRSLRSVENLRAICDKYLPGNFNLEVIDIYQQPAMAASVQLVAAPTLIKSLPLPLRRLVGDFSDQQRVLRGLDIAV